MKKYFLKNNKRWSKNNWRWPLASLFMMSNPPRPVDGPISVREWSNRLRDGWRLGQVRSGQVRSGQVRSGQVRSGQVRSGQVRSGQVRLGFKKHFQCSKSPWVFFTMILIKWFLMSDPISARAHQNSRKSNRHFLASKPNLLTLRFCLSTWNQFFVEGVGTGRFWPNFYFGGNIIWIIWTRFHLK
jgi:hypothetical protein